MNWTRGSGFGARNYFFNRSVFSLLLSEISQKHTNKSLQTEIKNQTSKMKIINLKSKSKIQNPNPKSKSKSKIENYKLKTKNQKLKLKSKHINIDFSQRFNII